MSRMMRVALALAVSATVVGLAVAPAAARPIALTGATVHTVSGATLERATVVMDGGKIVAVGADVTPPVGAEVVACDGKHIYPGFILPLSTLGLIEVGSVLGTADWNETGNVNPNIRAEVQINPDSEMLRVARINGVTSALVVPRGGALNGTSALIHLDGWTFEDMTVRAPVGLHIQWPAMNPVRSFEERRTEEEQKKAREQALQSIRDAFDDARAYGQARAAEGKAGVPRHDQDIKWDAMRKALAGEIPVLIHATTLAQIRGALRFVDEQQLKNVVLVGAADASMIADEIKSRDIAVIASPTLSLPRRSYEPYDKEMNGPARLHAAGLRYCIADAGTSNWSMLARNLPYQAAMAAAYGLPREEALKAITLYPAQIFGVADRLGSIETGKIADLQVTNGDPLEITTQVEQVYIAGVPIAMDNRQTRLFEKYDSRPRGPKARPRDTKTVSSR